MSPIKPLSEFLAAISKDPHISLSHIGVFAVLLELWSANRCCNPVMAYSYQVMKIAKISSSTTYHKCIRDLADFGYLRYEPSFKNNRPSKIYIFCDAAC